MYLIESCKSEPYLVATRPCSWSTLWAGPHGPAAGSQCRQRDEACWTPKRLFAHWGLGCSKSTENPEVKGRDSLVMVQTDVRDYYCVLIIGYERDLFIAWFQQVLLRRLQLGLCRLLGVLGRGVCGHLASSRWALVLFGWAGLVWKSRSRAVCHRQLRFLLLRRLLLRQLLRLAKLRLTAAEVCVGGVEEEVPALRAGLWRSGGGWSVDGSLWLQVRGGDGWLADRVNGGRGRGQRGRCAGASCGLRCDAHQVLLLKRILRRQNGGRMIKKTQTINIFHVIEKQQ